MLQAGQSPFQRHALAHLKQMQTLVNAICLEEKLARRDKTPHLTRADEWLSTNGFYILGGSLQQEQKVQTKKTHCRFLGSELLCLLSPPLFSVECLYYALG
eukprot:TRINITY_DN25434_c0_g1_i1.p1 TRINITY_DN25434_c0_g1~~TRINITY_DN25434_c0_g1_i1.p1  ORF type:complete len:101 (+),score=5.03 TRINITY_DN25434_c0_g1_i1:486-788(+)